MDLQVLIYLGVGVFAIGYSVYKNLNKKKSHQAPRKQVQNPYKGSGQQPVKKVTGNQTKSLEDIINTLLNEPQVSVNKEVKKEVVIGSSFVEEPNVELEKQEAQYYSQDTELVFSDEMVDYDIEEDHRLTMNKENGTTEGGEQPDWLKTDWGKAVILAEVLQRPKY